MSLAMDTSKFRAESHVAQQIRRDKLRVHRFEEYLNPDLVQVRSVRNANLLYDPTLDSSSATTIVPNSNVLPPQMPTNDSSNWMMGYANGSLAATGRPNNENPMIFGDEICCQEDDDGKRHSGELLHFVSSSSLYQNSLQDIVTTASVAADPIGAHQPSPVHFDNDGAWTNRPVLLEHCQQWGGELGFSAGKSNEEPRAGADDANTNNTTQGLSLTLSSNPSSKIRDAAQFAKEVQDPMHKKPSMIRKGSANSTYSSPLGPFTGYATILKNSRFLKPAQELLDQYCHVTNLKLGEVCEASEGVSGDIGDSALADVANAIDTEDGAITRSNSGASFCRSHRSNEIRVDVGAGSSSGESCRPEFQQKKAKLLFLQEEVCRRYKLYYQQIEMVFSSFESVAGLTTATPYVSLALKTVEMNFRCIRKAISGSVRHISKAPGEDLLSTTTGGVNAGFVEPQQQGWRPQRGLPERAVTILRAWLFEHFLHPYPTDTDKHMLATQTGLTRNQVSNWFINARVRVWKPMVEEIHMLESKGTAEGNNQNLSKSDAKPTHDRGTIRPNEDRSISRSCVNATSDRRSACLEMTVPRILGDANDSELWCHDKRSRMDFRIPTNTEAEGTFLSFAPYEQSRLEFAGLGAVSLTLGLRHGVETAQAQQQHHQQRYQAQEDQLRRQFGGRMIHDFVG